MPAYEKTLNEIKQEFPKFALRRKSSSALMQCISVALTIITFGRFSDFMQRFITTIGYVVYIPSHWDDLDPIDRACILRHERVHMRQRRRMGDFMFTLRYLWWPLPAVFASGRRDLEMEAYEESMRASAFYHGVGILNDEYKEELIGHFTGPQYFWMWPFRGAIEAWYRGVLEKIRAEHQAN